LASRAAAHHAAALSCGRRLRLRLARRAHHLSRSGHCETKQSKSSKGQNTHLRVLRS
jgi:hypothetical protein